MIEEMGMKRKHGIRIGIALTSTFCAFAQGGFEISHVYSYLHLDPTTTGGSSRNFNPGGGTGIALNFLKIFAIRAEAIGYSSALFTKIYTSTQTVPGVGTIPPGTYSAQIPVRLFSGIGDQKQ